MKVNNLLSLPISLPKAVCREIKKGVTEIAAGVSGMFIDSFGGGALSVYHAGHRIKDTFINIVNNEDMPSVLKPFPIAFSPVMAAIKVAATMVIGLAIGLVEGTHDVVYGSTLKESIQNRIDDLKCLNRDLADADDIYEIT